MKTKQQAGVLAALKISCNFPGGNIVVEEIKGDTVRLHQDLRDTRGDWFYWYFSVSGAAGRTLIFEFTQSPAIGARGPAVSRDGGATWHWLGSGSPHHFSYTFPTTGGEVFFCVTIPYTEAHWRKFLSRLAPRPLLKPGVLCLSKKGRAVETLSLGCLQGEPEHCVIIAARHHSCESMASFALEGLVEYLLADEPEATKLAASAEVWVVPFVDKDGVEDGDQGKNRKPRDHNRDYDGTSAHLETAALRTRIPGWARSGTTVALDLHCPWLYGGLNEQIYLVGSSSEEMWKEQQKFGAILESASTGPLPCHMDDYLPFGREWNTEANFKQGTSFTDWLTSLAGVRLASTVELPYATARGVEVNAARARAFGSDLARALARYLV